jgi:hypothetical protein
MNKPLSVASPAAQPDSPRRGKTGTEARRIAAPASSKRLQPLLPLLAVCIAAALHSTPLQQAGRGMPNAEQRAELERAQRWDHRLQSFRKSRVRIELNEQLDQGQRAVAIRRLAESSFAADEIRWLEAAEQFAWARSGGNR